MEYGNNLNPTTSNQGYALLRESDSSHSMDETGTPSDRTPREETRKKFKSVIKQGLAKIRRVAAGLCLRPTDLLVTMTTE